MFPERSFDESPDEKRYEEDEAQDFDALFRFEEDRVHHGRVLEERKVLLHPVLLFVEGENLFGVGGSLTFFGDIGQKDEASCFGLHLCHRRGLLFQMATHLIADLSDLSGLVLLGPHAGEVQRRTFRKEMQNQYTAKTLTQEVLLSGKTICQTEIFQILHKRYVHNLKENVLDPFLQNANFRSAIKDYATESFKSYDKRIRGDVKLLIDNLNRKYGYTEQGAKEVCIYVIDNNIAQAFAGTQAGDGVAVRSEE